MNLNWNYIYIFLLIERPHTGCLQPAQSIAVQKRSIRVKISDFFVPCDLQIWWMTLKNNREPLLCDVKLCASFQSHQWIKTWITVQEWQFFVPCDLEIWRMTLKNNRAPFLCCFKLYALFHSHQWIQTGVTVRKHPLWVKIDYFGPMWPSNLTDDLENQGKSEGFDSCDWPNNLTQIGFK